MSTASVCEMDEVERDEFSVYVFRPDGSYSRELSFVSAERAVRYARMVVRATWREAAQVVITDGGDHTVFLWRRNEGVVFPPRTKG